MHERVKQIVKELMERMRIVTKRKLKDPDMCEVVKDMIDISVDHLWPEIEEEINYQLTLKISEAYVEIPYKQVFCLFYPIQFLQNNYLYTNYPYDRTVWRQMKTFSYWFWKIAMAVPFYGISSFTFVLDFLFRDKGDEY